MKIGSREIERLELRLGLSRVPDLRAKPIHLTLNPLKRPVARNAVKVLFSDKNLTNMPRFAEEWRRSIVSHPCPSSFAPSILLSSRATVLPSPGEGGEQRVTLKLLRPNKT